LGKVEPNLIHLWERWSQTLSTFGKGGAKPYPPLGKVEPNLIHLWERWSQTFAEYGVKKL